MGPIVPGFEFRVPSWSASDRLPAGSLQPETRNPKPGTEQKGSVLVLAMILVAVLALIATAFIITARLEGKATTNSLRGLQAETACRLGLAAAVYQIAATRESCYSLDSATGWHGYFRDIAATSPDLCPDTWVQHYDATQPGYEMKAKRWQLSRVAPGDTSSGHIKKLKRKRGFTSDYYVAVADLDGKLRANPKNWDTLIAGDDAKLQSMLRCFLSTDARAIVVRDHVAPIWSLGAMRSAYNLNTAAEMTEIESYMTSYPRRLSSLSPATDRPAVNVNTARRDVLEAIVLNVPGLAAEASTVAQKLVDERPFTDRKDMEEALDDLAPGPLGNGKLTEQQFNDLLNSLAGTNAETESDYDKPGSPGIYEYDVSAVSTSGGDHTVVGAGPVSADYTWGTEVKFTSRFFHIYVMSQTVADDAERRPLAERRLHAVYDALTRKILWKRWHFYAKANMED
jgi:hypothetical protein